LEGHLALEWEAFKQALFNSRGQLQARTDELKWTRGDLSCQISFKNIYEATEEKNWKFFIGGWRKSLWFCDYPLEIKIFVWLIAKNKIITWENLQHRGHFRPGLCYLFKNYKENVLHLFVDCPFTITIWDSIKTTIPHISGWTGNSIAGCFKNWKAQNHSNPSLSSFTCWFIWLERNYNIFEEGTPSIHKALYKMLGDVGDYNK